VEQQRPVDRAQTGNQAGGFVGGADTGRHPFLPSIRPPNATRRKRIWGLSAPADRRAADGSVFDQLKQLVDSEGSGIADSDWLGMLAAIGIAKDQPFKPDDHAREILDRAAKTAYRMSSGLTLYEAENASGLANGQPFPSLGSRDKPAPNADGSIDLFLGPTAPEAKAGNWLAQRRRVGFPPDPAMAPTRFRETVPVVRIAAMRRKAVFKRRSGLWSPRDQ
jgi:hypothetical protein